MRLVDAVYARIEDLAKERRLSMNALANLCGVPHPTIATMKRSTTVKLSTIYGICAGLDLSLQEFFNSPRFNKDIITD
ncbi:MAG: helix-turn-helix domain-containing protein [Roseburia sp.]|nr:helix-turn-helix domain-containing protein [Roseburia sp.]